MNLDVMFLHNPTIKANGVQSQYMAINPLFAGMIRLSDQCYTEHMQGPDVKDIILKLCCPPKL